MEEHSQPTSPVVVAGAVKGSGHGEHGAELIARVREAGMQVIDLGGDVAPARFAGAIRDHRPVAVVLTCQLVVCAGGVSGVIEELERQGLRATARILVTGQALTDEFALSVGADGFAADAADGASTLSGWIAA